MLRLVSVETEEIRQTINDLWALAENTPHCPGPGENYQEGTTCLRCGAMIRMNTWLPEGERVKGVAEE